MKAASLALRESNRESDRVRASGRGRDPHCIHSVRFVTFHVGVYHGCHGKSRVVCSDRLLFRRMMR